MQNEISKNSKRDSLSLIKNLEKNDRGETLIPYNLLQAIIWRTYCTKMKDGRLVILKETLKRLQKIR